MTRMADWAEPIQVEHMYRELFGSTLMLVDQARWEDGSPGTAAETMQRFRQAMPPIHQHCEVFTEVEVDEAAMQITFTDEARGKVFRLSARPDGLWDLCVRKPGLQSDELSLVQDVVLLKLLAYDCGPAGEVPLGEIFE